ncbi:MAG: F0F1 ATP synthase subunit delta [Mycoplasmataceae bacterium]|jgi:F-type H+-transporting ATPase subunit delta|nr:F0F1 ATP synthase subunit delta [Mycoplasmataceae bacterium]
MTFDQTIVDNYTIVMQEIVKKRKLDKEVVYQHAVDLYENLTNLIKEGDRQHGAMLSLLSKEQVKDFYNAILEHFNLAFFDRLFDTVVEFGHAGYLLYIIENYINHINGINKDIKVQIVTAFPLTNAQTNAIAKAVERYTKKRVAYTVKIDENVLGGIRIEAVNFVIDNTIEYKINKILQLNIG